MRSNKVLTGHPSGIASVDRSKSRSQTSNTNLVASSLPIFGGGLSFEERPAFESDAFVAESVSLR